MLQSQISACNYEKYYAEASDSERKRCHVLLHSSHEELIQKIVIFMVQGSYVPPHRHLQSHQSELFCHLDGELEVILFNHDGIVTERRLINNDSMKLFEIPVGVWHTIICRSKKASFLEIKQGPHFEHSAKEFAPWAPVENSALCSDYLNRLLCYE